MFALTLNRRRREKPCLFCVYFELEEHSQVFGEDLITPFDDQSKRWTRKTHIEKLKNSVSQPHWGSIEGPLKPPQYDFVVMVRGISMGTQLRPLDAV